MAGTNENQWCYSWLATHPKATGTEKAALVKSARWNSGDVISISFLDGDPTVIGKVINVAQQWTAPGMANLQLEFRTDTTNTLVRVSFQYAGSWSVIGTTCRQITDLRQPTMNYGWLTPSSNDDEIRRVVLHEFGHALGLIHEHQNPAGGIHWNKEAVYQDLSGPPNSWDRATIDHNMFQTYDANLTNFTQLDPQSIMMYPLPARWTTDGFSVGLNSTLSNEDRKFIQEQYP